jgi:hypothetical protein
MLWGLWVWAESVARLRQGASPTIGGDYLPRRCRRRRDVYAPGAEGEGGDEAGGEAPRSEDGSGGGGGSSGGGPRIPGIDMSSLG